MKVSVFISCTYPLMATTFSFETLKLTDYNKPIPDPDPYTSGPFWEGAKEGKSDGSRQEFSNVYLYQVEKFGLDKGENDSLKVCQESGPC